METETSTTSSQVSTQRSTPPPHAAIEPRLTPSPFCRRAAPQKPAEEPTPVAAAPVEETPIAAAPVAVAPIAPAAAPVEEKKVEVKEKVEEAAVGKHNA